MSSLSDYVRYWPYGAAVLLGVCFAVIDRRVFGRKVLCALLIVTIAGGAVGMNVSPFTFQGGDYYMESLIAMVAAAAALAGYLCAAAWYAVSMRRGMSP